MDKLNKKRILLISYYYPPVKAVGTLRNLNVSEQLNKYFNKLEVFSTTNSRLLDKEDLNIPKGVKVTYLPTFDYQTLRRLLPKRKKPIKVNTESKNGYSFLSKLIDSFPFSILFGEGGLIYILSGIILGLFRLRQIDYIYSSFRPFSDHYIAYVLKFFKPSIKWIADFRDIHIEPNGDNVLFSTFQTYIDKRIFGRADLFTCVSNGYINSLKAFHDSPNLIRNGYSDVIQSKFDSVPPGKNNYFSITHCGGLYGGRRNPSMVMLAVSELISEDKINAVDLRMEYAGNEGALWTEYCAKYGLSEICLDHGLVSLDDSLRLQKQAGMNFLITWTNKNGGTFPAKFYEYLIAGPPILLLINGAQDIEFESIFEELDPGILIYNKQEDLKALKNHLYKEYLKWGTGSNQTKQLSENDLKVYHWDKLGNDLATLISKI